jgi:predicted nicotinamide N-methyase
MLKHQTKGKRILEVGCGIALASMVLNQRLADITATDYHPETEGFLDYNTSLNNAPKIPFIRAEWNNTDNSLGVFDIIIGSDLLYERDHADMLSKFINRHAKKDCDVIIVDPRRGNHSSFTKKMKNFNFSCRQENAHISVDLKNANKNIILNYSR